MDHSFHLFTDPFSRLGGWGKPPVNEQGQPLYGDVFGTDYTGYKQVFWLFFYLPYVAIHDTSCIYLKLLNWWEHDDLDSTFDDIDKTLKCLWRRNWTVSLRQEAEPELTDTTLWGALESESESESEDEKEEEKPDDSGIVTPAEGYVSLFVCLFYFA